MTLTPDGKAQIIAAVLTSPMILEIVKAVPQAKWDQPGEVANVVATFAQDIIKVCEQAIP